MDGADVPPARVLVDEHLQVRFAQELDRRLGGGSACIHAVHAGFGGFANGELQDAAATANYRALVTAGRDAWLACLWNGWRGSTPINWCHRRSHGRGFASSIAGRAFGVAVAGLDEEYLGLRGRTCLGGCRWRGSAWTTSQPWRRLPPSGPRSIDEALAR